MNYHEIIDKQIWEAFINESGIATSFFQSWNWGEFQKALGKPVMRFGFYNDANELFALAQGVEIHARRGKYLYVRNGPIAPWQNENQVEFIINSISIYCKEKQLWFWRMSPLVTEAEETEWLECYQNISPMSDVDALDTWVLDLSQSEAEIQKNMRKTTRYEIRRAEKDGVTIESTKDPERIKDFYPIYLDTIQRQRWTGYSEEYITKQFTAFVIDNSAGLFLAKYQGKYIAAAIFIYHGESSYYHYSGSLTEFRKIPAPALIQWYNIQEAKKRGLKFYNFWGIAPENRPDHPWQGLSFFKMGFGGEAVRYIPARDIPVSKLYGITKLIEQWDKKRKGY
ncbi:MAG: peptidoglycan bridge formation glycyltransferase FemA/FemB family protein [bacterium]